ncbi:MAG: VOC family protein [Gammaproteobacteria bacterium]
MARPPAVRWTFHGTAAVRSYADTLAWLDRFVGCKALEWSDAPPPVARIGGCCWLADNQLELAEPNAKDSPTAKFIERFGPGYLNLAVQVDDLGAAHEWFSARGAVPILPPDNHFTFTHPAHICGLQFEWADMRDLDWDPRHLAKAPARGSPLIDAPRIAHWGGMVADPKAAVARIVELCPMNVAFERYDAPAGAPAAALSLQDGLLTLYRAPADEAEALRLWGTRVAKPRFHHMAFRVRDLAAAQATFGREGVRILRGSAPEGEIVTHPDDTQGLCMVWTDRDLPGDPRGPLGA